MLQQNQNKNNPDKDLSKSTSRLFEKFQIKGGRFEKRLFVLMILIVVAIIPLTVWQFGKNLEDSFFISEDDIVNNSNTNQLADNTDGESPVLIENLRELDTDMDGLNDYDELYRYKTSPYIKDSDSDSVTDNIEVEQQTDPNCPEGTTCSREEFIVPDETATNTNEETTTPAKAETLSVDQLRQIMIDAGAPEDEVYKISEADLRATYNEILAAEGIKTTNSNSNSNSSNSNQDNKDILNLNSDDTNSDDSIYSNLDYETLLNLQPADIRALLVEGGVSAEELSAIDDATLKQIYKESLYQNFSESNQ